MDHIHGEQKGQLQKLSAQRRRRKATYFGVFILAIVTAAVVVYEITRA